MGLKSLAVGVLFAMVANGGNAFAQADDMARYLAGLAPDPQSPLARLAQNPAWNQHARELDTNWSELDRLQLPKVRRFARRMLGLRPQVVHYFFSGPDFAYADALFPDAQTYIMTGLEAIGAMPDAEAGGERLLARTRLSLRDLFSLGFFKTESMAPDSAFIGVVPMLSVLLVRTGKRLRAVSRVTVTTEGALVPAAEGDVTPGVRFDFTDADGRLKELLYFNVNLSNAALMGSGFLAYCDKTGTGVALIKSASYLLHRERFSQVRTFLLERASAIVQDDTGIPFRYLDNQAWRVRLFGSYLSPIGQFAPFDQPDLARRARERRPEPIDFGFGYLSGVRPSHLLVAVRSAAAAPAQR